MLCRMNTRTIQVLSVELLNQRVPTCVRCDGHFHVVLPGRSDQERLARVFSRSRIEFIGALRESTGCTLRDAKGIAGHVTGAVGYGQCHRCGGAIRDRLLDDCRRCRSLNIQLGRPSEDLTCPACGFAVFGEDTYGSYEICEVCGWEDDGVQLANPTSGGGANHRSLAEVQAEILIRIPLNVNTHGELVRDPLWRPLNEGELADADSKRSITHWHTPAVCDRSEVYWL